MMVPGMVEAQPDLPQPPMPAISQVVVEIEPPLPVGVTLLKFSISSPECASPQFHMHVVEGFIDIVTFFSECEAAGDAVIR